MANPVLSNSIAGIACSDESTQEIFTLATGFQAKRTIVCAWADRFRLAAALLGAPAIPGAPNVTGGKYPEATNSFVQKITTDHRDGSTGRTPSSDNLVASTYAQLVVEYGPPTVPGGGGSYNPDLIEVDFDLDVVTLPKDYLKIGGKSTGVPHGLLVPTAKLTVPRSGLQTLPVATYFSLGGTINSDTPYGAGANRMMFLFAKSRQRYLPNGLFVFDVSLPFKVRGSAATVPHWNQGFISTASGPQDYDAPKPFTANALSPLFT